MQRQYTSKENQIKNLAMKKTGKVSISVKLMVPIALVIVIISIVAVLIILSTSKSKIEKTLADDANQFYIKTNTEIDRISQKNLQLASLFAASETVKEG